MSTSKSEAFLWGGAITLFIGVIGTGLSTYFMMTSKDNDPNATIKKVGLAMSVVMAVIGIVLMIYYYKGSMFDSVGGGGSCPVVDAIEQGAAVSDPGPQTQVPPPKMGATTFNINVNNPQPK
jgi:hypothetical protein